MSEKKPTRTIRQEISIPEASPRDVYNSLLSSKQHSEFTGSRAKCSSKPGARFTAWDGYISGRNVELVEGKKIVQEWKTTEWPDGYKPSILTISLKKEGNGTRLTMVQTRVPAAQYEEYDKGWHDSYWDPMKEYFHRRTLKK